MAGGFVTILDSVSAKVVRFGIDSSFPGHENMRHVDSRSEVNVRHLERERASSGAICTLYRTGK